MHLTDLADFLDEWLEVARLPPEQNGVFLPSSRPIQRLGLALEPTADIARRVTEVPLDAVFLHRPWKLNRTDWPAEVGVLAYHSAFDERLTVGYNPTLITLLGMRAVMPFGEKAGRPLGMYGEIPAQSGEAFRQ